MRPSVGKTSNRGTAGDFGTFLADLKGRVSVEATGC